MIKYFNRGDRITTKINEGRTLTLFTFEETVRRDASYIRYITVIDFRIVNYAILRLLVESD